MTSTHDEQFDRLVFGEFLAHLQRQGFTIGVDQHLRLQQLLARIGGQCAPHELRTLLCPLFATSQKQQATFYRVFDESFAFFFSTEHPAAENRPATENNFLQEETQQPAKVPPPTKRAKLAVTVMAVAALLLVCAAIWLWRNERFRLAAGTWEITLPPAPVVVPLKSPTLTPNVIPSASIPIASPPTPKPPDDFVLDHPWMLRLPALLLPLLTVLFYLLWRWRRRRLVIKKSSARKPPFTWPVSVAGVLIPALDHAQLFYQAARGLRRRQLGEFGHLDLPRTILATIAARGYPIFRYRAVSRLPEYLVLIDRASRLDHQARLFDHLAKLLESEGLFVVRYFYNGDPRICRSGETGEELFLTEVHRKYPAHRLVLMGDGARLLDPVTGEFNEWASLLTEWPERAVLTPIRLRAWCWRERVLSEYFTLLPGTLAGLVEMAERYDLPLVAESLLYDEAIPAPTLPETEYNVTVEKLQRYLGPEAFQWLCACAVYPEMQWELTLRLGELAMVNQLDEATLWRLLRLPWFRHGTIPDDVRLVLVQALNPARERAVRKFIIQVLEQSITEALEKNPTETASYAADDRRLEIAVQEAWLARDNWRDLKQALEKIKTLPPEEVRRDYTLMELLADRPTSPLALVLKLVLPSQIRRLFYPDGVSFFGVRWRAAMALALLAALLAWGSVESLIQHKRSESSTASAVRLFEFETVRLDRNGKEIERRKLQAQYFTEDLSNGTTLEMVEVPSGRFQMGSPLSEADRGSDEEPQHEVTVSSFCMGKFEVTQAQWQAVMGSNPSSFNGDGNLPVDRVSWNDTQEFLRKLNARSSLQGKGYRLPTEAEWEYAARAGTTTPFTFGETITSQIVNYDGEFPYADAPKGLYRQTAVQVGSLGVANAFGLFDMHGNVWEWCQDVWHSDYNAATSDGSAWLSGGNLSPRVLRGGSWYDNGDDCRAACRYKLAPSDIVNNRGFRIVSARTQ